MKRKKLSCIALLLLMFFAFGIVAESVALAAPIGEWKFDEGHGILTDDSSGQGKTGRIWGSTFEWVDGIRNKALQFASSADYVQAAPSITGGASSLTNWSVTAYIKPTGSSEGYVYSEKDSGNSRYLSISITGDNRIKVETWHKARQNGWDSYQTDPGKITRNEWNHLVVTLENGGADAKSGTVKCYVDGRLVGKGYLGACRAGSLIAEEAGAAGAIWEVKWGTGLARRGTAVGKSPGASFNNIYPWSQMKQETISTNKGNKTVVKIPKFYYKRTYDGEFHVFWIAASARSGFKLHPAFKRSDGDKECIYVEVNKYGNDEGIGSARSVAEEYGTGWGLIDIKTWSAIQMLWLVEYADTDSQKFSANYRGINGLWTSPGQWIDGITSSGTVVIEGKNTGLTLATDTWITDWLYSPNYDWLFLPSAGNGNESSYIPDYIRQLYPTASLFAGYGQEVNGSRAGLFSWGLRHVSNIAYYVGGRAQYIP